MQKKEILAGISKGFPVFVGYLPIGFAYGILAMQAGFTIFETILMSILVYAGSGQFIAVGMIGAGAGLASIVLTTFLVNLRHLLMSASLSNYLKGIKKTKLAAFAYHITDESFAVNSSWLKTDSKIPFPSLAAVNITSYLGWVLGGTIGAFAGSQAIDVEKYGLDYALPAMFIILLIYQLENKKFLTLAILAGTMSIFLADLLPHNLHIILTTVLVSTLGVLWTKLSRAKGVINHG